MNKSLAAMNGALGSGSPLLLLFAAFRGNFLCPLRGSNSFLQMWGNLSAPGVAAHPCTKQGWEKWGYTEAFSVYATLSAPQQVSACPIIQRSTLADSVAAYYCNCMCTSWLCKQGKKAFCCTLIENYWGDVKACCAAATLQYKYIPFTLWLHWGFFPVCKLDHSFICADNSCIWNEWPVRWTRFLQDKHFLRAFVLIYNHSAAKSIVKEFYCVRHIPRG